MTKAAPWTVFFCLALWAATEVRQRRVADADAMYQAALLAHRRGELALADEAMGDALRLAPDNACYLAYRGLLRHRMAGATDAAGMVGTGAGAATRGGASADREKLRAAADSYEAALRLSPEDGLFHHNLGWLYFLLGDRERALAHLEGAAASRLRDPVYHVSLGIVRERCGEPDAAARDYAEAVALSPGVLGSDFFHQLRGRDARMAEAAVAAAVAGLEAELKATADPVAKARLGGICLDSDPGRAFTLLREAVEALPNLPRAWGNLGLLHGRKGDFAGMEACFRRAHFLDGDDPQTLLGMAEAYEAKGEGREAARCRLRAEAHGSRSHSAHAGRLTTLYRGVRRMEDDDMIPQGIWSYCAPAKMKPKFEAGD
ncbi:MAG: hypothetical protein LBT74_10560 [Acidobacteriota bacterium]|jgi:tetratricopeptide (TPR) repeat protein|nr:hypothetical protein [Acidobacteriota bacterium]